MAVDLGSKMERQNEPLDLMSLPVAATDETRRRLLLARGLYQAAVSAASAPLRSYRRIIAVLSLDAATEAALKAVVWDLGEGRATKGEFTPLLAQARALVAKETGASGGQPPPLPAEAGATDVHDIRNDAQHRARPPSDEVLVACRAHAHEFLVALAAKVWALDFDMLSASDAIADESIREAMAEADELLRQGDYVAASRSARLALDRASRLATAGQHRHRSFSSFQYQYSQMGQRTSVASIANDLEREFRDIREEMRRLALGLERSGQRRLASITGDYFHSAAGVQWDKEVRDVDRDGAEWAVSYCTDAVLQIEERFGPFEETAG